MRLLTLRGLVVYWWTEIYTVLLSALLSFCMSVYRPYPHHRERDERGTRLSAQVGIGGGV